MSTGRYLLKRIAGIILTMFLVSIFVFMIVRLIPGDPARILLGDQATPEMVETITKQYGLDKSYFEQYIIWIKNIFTGDFGISMRTKMPVMFEIGMRYWKTVKLAVCSIVWSVIAGILIGIWAGTHMQKWQDYTGITVSVLGQALPNFWIGMLVILLFCVKLNLVPIVPDGSLKSMILPAFTLGVSLMATVARFMRSSIIEALKEDYTRTARAKGLKERTVIYKHVLKNSLLPVITIVGMQFSVMLGGSVLVESVFGYNGIGLLLVDSINYRDYSVLQMLILIISLHLVVINLIVDMLYAALNPEIRLE
ncbi:MAG: ABC transporter permease [Firmicutes bacterium]|nr:ABC transporter permease [Bacillota bacterium]